MGSGECEMGSGECRIGSGECGMDRKTLHCTHYPLHLRAHAVWVCTHSLSEGVSKVTDVRDFLSIAVAWVTRGHRLEDQPRKKTDK